MRGKEKMRVRRLDDGKKEEALRENSITLGHVISESLREGSHVLVPGSIYFVGISLNFPFHFVFKAYAQVFIRCFLTSKDIN